MTGVLTAAAVIMVLSLMASAAGTLGRASAADPHRRGRWGMLTRTSQRVQPLNPQERRWQTALIAGKDNESRWRDVVVELETLQRLNSISSSQPAPASYDSRWLGRTISELEASIDAKTTSDHGSSSGAQTTTDPNTAEDAKS